MSTLGLGVAGAVVGGFVGAPGMGFVLGTALGRSILGGHTSVQLPTQYGSRLSDLKVQSGQWGTPIPRVYGTYRIAGNVIWATPIVETTQTATQSQFIPSGKGGHRHHYGQTITQSTVTYRYFASFAIALCQGPIAGIRQIWADGKRLSIKPLTSASPIATKSNFVQSIRLYTGTENQLPDPLIEAHQGIDQVPAFRDLAYLVFENFELADFGNRIPNFSFEVVQAGWEKVNVSPEIAHYNSEKNYPLSEVFTIAGGLIQCKIVESETLYHTSVLPQRVDFDRNLNELQRIVGQNIKPNLSYRAVIKGTPNLFVISESYPNQWYDIATGQHQNVVGQFIPIQQGVYGTKRLYVITSQDGTTAYSLRIYAVESAESLPGDLLHEIILYGKYFYQGETIVDMDLQQGMLFGIESRRSQLIAFDPIHLKPLHAWTIQFPPASLSNPWMGAEYKLSIHPAKPCALITQIDDVASKAFIVHWDFSQTKLVAEELDIPPLKGRGLFAWIDDHHLLVGGSESQSPIRFTQGQGFKARIYDLSVQDPTSPYLSDVIIDILNQVNFPKDAVDVTCLKETLVPGFVISQPISAREILTILQQVYDLEIVEIGFQLVFRLKETIEITKIPEEVIGAHEVGQSTEDLKITYLEPNHFPGVLHLLFSDRHHDYQQGHVCAYQKQTTSLHADTIELPFALTVDESLIIAERLLEKIWQKRIVSAFTLPRSHAFLNPGDLIELREKIWQLTEKTYGDPGLLQVKAYFVKDVDNQLPEKIVPVKSDATLLPIFKKLPHITLPSPTQCFFIELALLADKPDEKQWYAILSGIAKDWSGSTLMASIDQGESFFPLFHQTIGATYGWTRSTLPAYQVSVPLNGTPQLITSGSVNNPQQVPNNSSSAEASEQKLDTTHSVCVKLTWGELSSVTEEALKQGTNRCLLGNEVLQFQTAILQADGSYLLQNLLRGQCHTESVMNQHQIGEHFILIDPTTWHLLKPPTTMSTLPRYYKAVTDGQSFQDAHTHILQA